MPGRIRMGLSPLKELKLPLKKDHLVIIGFGFNGRNLACATRVRGIPYSIIEMNPETVRAEKAKGEPIHYGDATHEAVLHRAAVKDARVAVVAISDPTATRRIVELVRKVSPRIYVIVRTRFIQEVKRLRGLGADEVIPEEFETSVEIFARVLEKYLVPKDEIDKYIDEIRAEDYDVLGPDELRKLRWCKRIDGRTSPE
jgi:CPA2 family monovalent cation:H+ antiporter-2